MHRSLFKGFAHFPKQSEEEILKMKKSIVKVMVIIGVAFAVLFIGLFLLVMCSSDDAGEEYSTGKIESEYQNDTGSQTAEEKENLTCIIHRMNRYRHKAA